MRTVLVVDDEYDIAEAVGTILSLRGYAVVVANNGKLAFAALAEQRPDVILLDVMMPVMTGIDLLRQLKGSDEHRAIPVVLMSAVGDGVLSRADESLTAGYLRKPFSFEELMDALARADPAG
jgi:CheY-like chemotaxis protein